MRCKWLAVSIIYKGMVRRQLWHGSTDKLALACVADDLRTADVPVDPFVNTCCSLLGDPAGC